MKILNLLFFVFLFFNIVSEANNWIPLNSPAITNSTGFVISKKHNVLVISSFSEGIFRSVDKGRNWTQTFEGSSIYCLHQVNDSLIIAGGKGEVIISKNAGLTWGRFSIGPDVPVGNITVHPSGKIFLATGNYFPFFDGAAGILMSADTGKTWTSKSKNINAANNWIQSVGVTKSGMLLAGANDKGLYYSTNEGENWQLLKFDIHLPFSGTMLKDGITYNDVFFVNTCDDYITASISGSYQSTFFLFSVKTPEAHLMVEDNIWQPLWAIDSTPSSTSIYPPFTTIYSDSKGMEWASVAEMSNYTTNTIFSGQINQKTAWYGVENSHSSNQLGHFLFAEDAAGSLYSISYWGNQIFLNSPIPTVITTLYASHENPVVKINWSSLEIDCDSFYVERTSDLNSYARIHAVKAIGNSTSTTNYQITDEIPLDGTSFYRLISISTQKEINISLPVKMQITITSSIKTVSTPESIVFPNPVSKYHYTVVRTDCNKTSLLKVINLQGKVVYHASLSCIAGKSESIINMDLLNPGTYLIEIASEGFKTYEKLIITE